MNKIFIALVLAVVLSGNVFADIVYLYCDNELNEGYSINKKDKSYIMRYAKGKDTLSILAFTPIWSKDYVAGWHDERRREFRINRKTLTLEEKRVNEEYYSIHSQCFIVDIYDDWIELFKKKRAEQTKGNLF